MNEPRRRGQLVLIVCAMLFALFASVVAFNVGLAYGGEEVRELDLFHHHHHHGGWLGPIFVVFFGVVLLRTLFGPRHWHRCEHEVRKDA